MAGAVTPSTANTIDSASTPCEFLNYHGYSHTLQYFPPCGSDPITTVTGTMHGNNEDEHHHHKFSRYNNHNGSMVATAPDTMTFPASYLQDFASPTPATDTEGISSTTINDDNPYHHERFTAALLQHETEDCADLDDNSSDGKRKKPGQQKRSWNTENYQWMNIKRTRKIQHSEGKFSINNKVFLFFFPVVFSIGNKTVSDSSTVFTGKKNICIYHTKINQKITSDVRAVRNRLK